MTHCKKSLNSSNVEWASWDWIRLRKKLGTFKSTYKRPISTHTIQTQTIFFQPIRGCLHGYSQNHSRILFHWWNINNHNVERKNVCVDLDLYSNLPIGIKRCIKTREEKIAESAHFCRKCACAGRSATKRHCKRYEENWASAKKNTISSFWWKLELPIYYISHEVLHMVYGIFFVFNVSRVFRCKIK